MATCPNTGITIPECSCDRCLEEQVRRHMPELLDPRRRPRRTDPSRSEQPKRGWRRAA